MPERRRVPRFNYSCALQVRRAGGVQLPAFTTDVSLTGMGLTLTRKALLGLVDDEHTLMPGDRFEVILPVVDLANQAQAGLSARVRHVRRVSLEQYHVGVWFDAGDASQEAALARFVEQACGF